MKTPLIATATVAISVLTRTNVTQAATTSHTTHDHGESGVSTRTTQQTESHAISSHGIHDGEYFEALAVYNLEAGRNSIVVAPAEGSFGEERLAFMVVPAAAADVEGLEGAEEDAVAAWDAYLDGAEATTLASGEFASPSANVVYQIDLENPLVFVLLEVVDTGAYALFLEHGGGDVVKAVVSNSGTVVAAVVEEGTDEAEEEEEEGEGEVDEEATGPATASQWANAMTASLIVSACSFTGLVFVTNKRVANKIVLTHAFIFGSGALLTASLLHIIPEAIEGLEEEYSSLHDLGLFAGLTVLGGISVSIVIHALLATGGHSHAHDDLGVHGVEMGASGGGASGGGGSASVSGESGLLPPVVVGKGRAAEHGSSPGLHQRSDMAQSLFDVTQPFGDPGHNNLRTLMASRKGRSLLDVRNLQPVCWNIIAGDLVHNFADGVTIGAAFLTCRSITGWTVTASAVLHEVPHELADFMALLNGGMSAKQAVAYNFLSALTAIVGTITILALGDTLSDAQISFVLLLGAGSFVLIALLELLPEALPTSDATREHGGRAVLRSQLRKLVSFLVGAIVIGIPLMFDEHCSASGHDHDH